MTQTQEVTKTKFLDMYARKALNNLIGPVKVGSEERIYGCTSEGQANNPDMYIVVYCVV